MKKPITILYVDDNRLDRELVRDALTYDARKYKVVEAASRTQFDKYFAKGSYDLVLSDFNILGFEGLQVLEAIHAKSPGIPVIIVTGTGSEEVAVEAMKRGAADYIIKTPSHLRHLPHTIQTVLGKVRLEVDRKRVKEQLNESEEKFRTLFEDSRDAIFLTTVDGRVLEFNRAAEEMSGYKRKELLTLPVTGIYAHMDDRLKFMQAMESQGFVRDFELQLRKKDGTVIDCLTTASVRRDPAGKIIGYQGIIRDVTAHKRVQEIIQKSEDRLREAQKVAQIGCWELNLTTNALFWSDEIYRIFNINPQEFVGTYEAFLDSIHPNDREFVNSAYTESVKNHTPYDIVHRLLLKDGTVKYVNDRCETYYDDAGKPFRSIGTVQNITERVKSRKKLEEALEKAKEGERVKSLFLANMSHEIRTPLNAILGFTGLIEASTQHLVSDEEKGFFDTVKHSSDRLMRTVHEILDISQIAAGTYDLNMEDLELCNLVRDIINECRPMADEKSLTLECTTDLDSAFIHADKYGVSQAISNLIDNALKYTEQGKITVLLEESAEQYVLSIQDTGIGISKEYINNLYELFSQESEGYTKKFQGIGLGMAIAKRHLDLNHVDINVKSTKGVGTTFTLTFKPVKKRIHEKHVEKEEIKVTPPPEPIEKPTVLLVDDDPSSQKLTEYFLQGAHDVCFAVSVEGAKQQLKKQQVDLILLDLSLVGEEDGLDLVRHLRKTKKWRNIPIIALTAHAFTTDRDNCITAGCNDYLSKPIKREKLVEKIGKFV
jgi:PAS domain S-box-containing protein